MVKQNTIQTIDVTQQFGAVLEKNGFGADWNNEMDIEKAGIWDLCDALSGKDTSKFTQREASQEMKRRGV